MADPEDTLGSSVCAEFVLENWLSKENYPELLNQLGRFDKLTMNSFIDFITRIKNASKARRREVLLPYSKLNLEVGKVLIKEGFLESVKEEKKENKKNIMAILKFEKRLPILDGTQIISKPSLRIYKTSKNISSQRRGNRVFILSTNKGIMTNKEAAKKGLGGEILFAIW